MQEQSVEKILREMAFFSELKGDNPFKIRAWQNSAQILEDLGKEPADLVSSGEITKIPGVGKGTQALVKEFVETGRVGEHEALQKQFPPLILELLEVRGLGPKKIKALHEQLGIASLAELEYACSENRLVELKGFGEKTQNTILKNIEKIKSNKGKAILPMALQQAAEVKDELQELAGTKRVEETGALRRFLPVIDSLDFLMVGEEKSLKTADFSLTPDGSWRRVKSDQLTVRVWLTEENSFGTRLVETTGPETFVKSLGPLPKKKTEVEVLKKWIPPEARDLGKVPEKLVELQDIKGAFHMHTTWSDGKNSLEEMAEAAMEMGWEYIGISEHSQTAFYANGLNKERVLQQRKEIDRLQEKFSKLKIFHGIESDILTDGALDFPDSVLKQFDFVIASVHGQMRMPREEMTKRICRALENSATTWLGHWSGRLLLGREGFEFDEDKVLKTAEKCGKSIELNCNPYRLDVDWQFLPKIQAAGIPVGIFPDAHSVGGFHDMQYGLWMARKGGLQAKDVVNTKSLREMERWLAARK